MPAVILQELSHYSLKYIYYLMQSAFLRGRLLDNEKKSYNEEELIVQSILNLMFNDREYAVLASSSIHHIFQLRQYIVPMSWYRYPEMEQFQSYPQSADAPHVSMLSYDELMASVDPDPFYSDSEKLLQSSSSAGQYGSGYDNKDRYMVQGCDSTSSRVNDETNVHFSKALYEDASSCGSAASRSNETSSTDQSSRTLSVSEFGHRKQKRCFLCTICCFDICCTQDTTRDTSEDSLNGKAIFCGGCRNRSPSENSSLSESSGDYNQEEEEDRSFEESEINESVSFIESSESENEEQTTSIFKEFNYSLEKQNGDELSTGISMFVHSTPNAMSYKNPTHLFNLMQKKLWELVHKRIKSHPGELSVWIYKKREEDGYIAWAMLPIHAACIFGCPAHVMQTMIRSYPKGVTTGDAGWRLPVHLACRK